MPPSREATAATCTASPRKGRRSYAAKRQSSRSGSNPSKRESDPSGPRSSARPAPSGSCSGTAFTRSRRRRRRSSGRFSSPRERRSWTSSRSRRGNAMSDNIIEVQDLVKIYNGNVRAVDGISFHVARGEVFGFLGPNGAGKSTTIKVLTTLLQKTAGTVTVDGMTLEKDPAAIRKIIGYASQEVSVDDDLTGRENLRLQCMFQHRHREEADARINELLKATGLEEAADRLADRLCIVDQGKIVAEGTPASLKAEIGADVIELALKENGGTSAKSQASRVLGAVPGVQEIKDYDGGIMV